METVINITEKAAKKINSIFQDDQNASGKSLRIKVIGGGCSGLSYKMEYDNKTENDHVITLGNVSVVVDIKSAIYLKGTTLDFSDGLEGKGFLFKNPNATNTCGCGESFTV